MKWRMKMNDITLFKRLKEGDIFYIVIDKKRFPKIKQDNEGMIDINDGLWDSIDWFKDDPAPKIELLSELKKELLYKFLDIL